MGDGGKAQVTEAEGSTARPAVPSTFQRYFDEFLITHKDQRLLPDLRSLTATFQIIPAEAPETHWVLEVKEGVLTDVARDQRLCACSFRLDAPTFRQIATGQLAPSTAFFKQRVEINGDIEIGLRVATVLASFFRQFPFDPGI